MNARARRWQWGGSSFSGRGLAGVIALLSVLGFGTAAVPALLARPFPRAHDRPPVPPVASAPETADAAPEPGGTPESVPASRSAGRAAARRPRPDNRAPVVRRADFGSRTITTRGDLRLQIEAWDPDGDPLTIRTTWHLGGRVIETATPVLPRSAFARGDRLRATVVVGDGQDESPAFETDAFVVANAPPTITTFPKGFDATGSFVYPLGAVDPDGDRNLAFRLREGPDGMRIEAHEGTLTWRPRPGQTGRHRVVVEVDDGRGGLESQVFVLQVRRPLTPRSKLAER